MNTYSKVVTGICLNLIFGNLIAAGRQLPTDLVQKLSSLQTEFGKEAAKADNVQKEAVINLGRIRELRKIATPKQGSASNLGGAHLLMGIDGMDIYLRTFGGEAGSNRDALKLLAAIIGSILAGERYLKLDAALQELEKSEQTREANLKTVGKHFEQVVGVLQLARKSNQDSAGASVLDALDVFLIGQKADNTLIVDQYQDGIKAGTQAIREIVDKLAKAGG
jgi:hypothetical protein